MATGPREIFFRRENAKKKPGEKDNGEASGGPFIRAAPIYFHGYFSLFSEQLCLPNSSDIKTVLIARSDALWVHGVTLFHRTQNNIEGASRPFTRCLVEAAPPPTLDNSPPTLRMYA